MSNSSALPIHKLPDCTDWLTNIRAFRPLFVLKQLRIIKLRLNYLMHAEYPGFACRKYRPIELERGIEINSPAPTHSKTESD